MAPIQLPGEHAEPIEPVLMRRGALQADLPADCLPALAGRPKPKDARIKGIEQLGPFERLFHPADCRRRWQGSFQARWLLAQQVGVLRHDPGSGRVIALHTFLRQALENVDRLDDPGFHE